MQKLLLAKLQHNEFIHTGRWLAFIFFFFSRNTVKFSHCFLLTLAWIPVFLINLS